MRKVKKGDLWRVFLRSFYIQGSWNYERMLNLGVCFCLLPVGKRLFSGLKERTEFLKRHLGFFNAHPYLASYSLGAVARLEEKAIIERWKDYKPIEKLKERLCSPLGAIGDQLFWNILKPLAAIWGIILLIEAQYLGPIAFLILYNIPHIYYRYHGVLQGYRLDFDIIREISKRKYERLFKRLVPMGALSVGMLVVLCGHWTSSEGIAPLGVFIFSFLISYLLIRKKVSLYFIVLAILIGVIIASTVI